MNAKQTNGKKNGSKKSLKRTGAALIYSTIALTGFAAMVSIGVDWGHTELVKTELQAAADSAARAGAAGLGVNPATAISQTKLIASKNVANGSPVAVTDSNDVQIVNWNTKTLTYTVATGQAQLTANAVRVVARRDKQHGGSVTLPFTAMLDAKRSEQAVKAESIAMLIPAVTVDENVRAQANPFLAGAKKGTIASPINPHSNPDYAGDSTNLRASPTAVAGLGAMIEGAALNFDSIDGTARHDPNMAYFQPDGELGDIGHNNNTTSDAYSKSTKMFNENGIADAWIPINSLVGVFLDDNDPALTATPENLDFRSSDSREFTELKPKLKQVFFIGDGSTTDGAKQNFIVPKGATRLYLATWDFYEWNNNAGTREVKISRPQQIITVK